MTIKKIYSGCSIANVMSRISLIDGLVDSSYIEKKNQRRRSNIVMIKSIKMRVSIQSYDLIQAGIKNFIVCQSDFKYNFGDTLLIIECTKSGAVTGRTLLRTVGYTEVLGSRYSNNIESYISIMPSDDYMVTKENK